MIWTRDFMMMSSKIRREYSIISFYSYLESDLLLLTFFPACKWTNSRCLLTVSHHTRIYRPIITETGAKNAMTTVTMDMYSLLKFKEYQGFRYAIIGQKTVLCNYERLVGYVLPVYELYVTFVIWNCSTSFNIWPCYNPWRPNYGRDSPGWEYHQSSSFCSTTSTICKGPCYREISIKTKIKKVLFIKYWFNFHISLM